MRSDSDDPPVAWLRPRSVAGWFGIVLKVLAAVAYLLALSRAYRWPWALLATALGGLLIRVAFQSKGLIAEGATWSASADLLIGRHKYPGQLSLTSEEVTWAPSRYSERKRVAAVRVPLATSMVDLNAGPALLDVIVRITADGGGEPLRFLTRRSAGLRDATRNFGQDT